MSKQLYDEALADVKNLREVAEDNAKRDVFNAVLPRIRELIESHILNEGAPSEQSEEELLGLAGEDVNPEPHDPIQGGAGVVVVGQRAPGGCVDPVACPPPVAAAAISPSPDGGAVLDVDVALGNAPAGQQGGSSSLAPGEIQQPPTDTKAPPPVIGSTPDAVPPVPGADDEEFMLDMEGLNKLLTVTGTKRLSVQKLAEATKKLTAQFISLRTRAPRLTESRAFSARIDELLARVENTYDSVQESVVPPRHKVTLETRLEKLYRELNTMKESTMKSRKLREADEDLDLGGDEGGGEELDLGGDEESAPSDVLTIKVTNPSNPEEAQVELVTGGDEEGDEGGEEDLDLGDLGGDEGGDDLGGDMDEETVLEIDEGMLRRELRRMRMLREAEAVPSTKGKKPAAKEFDDFGDADSDGEPLNAKITTEGEGCPGDEDLDEGCPGDDEDLDETEKKDEKKDSKWLGTSGGPEGEEAERMRAGYERGDDLDESRLQKEHRLQRVLRRRMHRLQNEGTKAQGARRQQYRKAWVRAEHALKESRIRASKIVRRLNEAKSAGRSNTVLRQPAENTAAMGSLRKQLAEKNLLNAKLIYTNKLLQNESLTARQKAAIVERLDQARTVREAKLVYESASSANQGGGEKLNESRVVGSSSRVARPASTPQSLNESFETARWAKLAGIK